MQPQYYVPSGPTPATGLGVGDGFRFGCGFFIAGAITAIVMWVIMFVVFLLLGGVIGGIISEISRQMSFVWPILGALPV